MRKKERVLSACGIRNQNVCNFSIIQANLLEFHRENRKLLHWHQSTAANLLEKINQACHRLSFHLDHKDFLAIDYPRNPQSQSFHLKTPSIDQ